MAPLLVIMEVLREMLGPAAPDYVAHLPTPVPDDDDEEDEEEDKDRGSGGSIDPDDDEGGYDDDEEEEEPLQTRDPMARVRRKLRRVADIALPVRLR